MTSRTSKLAVFLMTSAAIGAAGCQHASSASQRTAVVLADGNQPGEGLTATGSSQAAHNGVQTEQSSNAAATPQPRITHRRVADYFEQASRHSDDSHEKRTLARLERQKQKFSVQFDANVECRGGVCRSELHVPTVDALEELRQLELAQDAETLYNARVFDLKNATVTVFTSLPGTTFAQALASSTKHTAGGH